MNTETLSGRRLLFWAIFLFAAIVRLKGISTGLPLHTLYGESETYQTLAKMLRTGDLNPYHYDFPGLAYYIYLPFLYLFYFIGNWMGYFPSIVSVPHASLILLARFLTACLGIGSVVLICKIGKFFSFGAALFAMAVLAAVPQHIEFSHMLRPEVPALFFVLLAHWMALRIYHTQTTKDYALFGLAAGAAFSIKYNIGLPLIALFLFVFFNRAQPRVWKNAVFFCCAFLLIFAVSNPYLLKDPFSLSYWMKQVDVFYRPMEEYYAKNVMLYYLEFLLRYNYNLPLLLFAGTGLALTLSKHARKGLLISLYPLLVFLWLSSSSARRPHGLLPLHPFIALYAALLLVEIWRITREFSRAFVFKFAYSLLIVVLLVWPYYRAGLQTYLFSKTDNRSKAEVWITNHLPKESKIALLQFHQIELDPSYFHIRNFVPKEYVNEKNFEWFRDAGFDYIVFSSGQYMRYFTEGETARKYNDYFLNFFHEASEKGTLVLDLATHPLFIPDYRIKVFSTRKTNELPHFFPAIDSTDFPLTHSLSQSGTTVSLRPGYYVLEAQHAEHFSISARNLKLDETIIRKQPDPYGTPHKISLPFAVFPVKVNTQVSLFERTQSQIVPDQPIRFSWKGLQGSPEVSRISPAMQVSGVQFLSVRNYDPPKPYLLFRKNETFELRCTLENRAKTNMEGYVEAYLSAIGEPEPWKNFESASETQDFFLEPGQNITIDMEMNTGDLTGDHQLSYWIFTRYDLPFSPQNGGWFNKQIRVDDPKLNIHPIYGIPIP